MLDRRDVIRNLGHIVELDRWLEPGTLGSATIESNNKAENRIISTLLWLSKTLVEKINAGRRSTT